MGFLMDGLDPEKYDRRYSDRALVTRIIRYFKPHTRKMTLVAVMILLTSLLSTVLRSSLSRGLDTLRSIPRRR
jgi:hypothetical protein